MSIKDILREFVNYINCLQNKEEKKERGEEDRELCDNKSHEKKHVPLFPKLPQQTTERGRYLW